MECFKLKGKGRVTGKGKYIAINKHIYIYIYCIYNFQKCKNPKISNIKY